MCVCVCVCVCVDLTGPICSSPVSGQGASHFLFFSSLQTSSATTLLQIFPSRVCEGSSRGCQTVCVCVHKWALVSLSACVCVCVCVCVCCLER